MYFLIVYTLITLIFFYPCFEGVPLSFSVFIGTATVVRSSSEFYSYWFQKIEETKTPVTKKRNIIYPEPFGPPKVLGQGLDIKFLSFLIGLIDGDGYIQAKKSS